MKPDDDIMSLHQILNRLHVRKIERGGRDTWVTFGQLLRVLFKEGGNSQVNPRLLHQSVDNGLSHHPSAQH